MQPIEGFQGKGEILSGCLDRASGQQCQNECPKRRCRDRMARKLGDQKNGKRMPAATALVAVGTEDPLPAFHFARRAGRIVAIENAVADQVSKAGAAWTRLLLERKSRPARAGASRTNRIQEGNISHCWRLPVSLPSRNFHGTSQKRDSGKKQAVQTDGTDGGALPALGS